jgi:hypothetical protein
LSDDEVLQNGVSKRKEQSQMISELTSTLRTRAHMTRPHAIFELAYMGIRGAA